MNDEKSISIPYIVHESEASRAERMIKRLWIMCIIIFLAFVASNGAWIVYENSFEDMTVEQDVDTGEGSAYVTGVGDINGASEANN